METILRAVSEHFGLTLIDLKGKRRTRTLAHPRQIAMYLSRELTNSSFPEIGQKIGNRDHSTVMYATAKVALSIKQDTELQEAVRSIRSSLGRWSCRKAVYIPGDSLVIFFQQTQTVDYCKVIFSFIPTLFSVSLRGWRVYPQYPQSLLLRLKD